MNNPKPEGEELLNDIVKEETVSKDISFQLMFGFPFPADYNRNFKVLYNQISNFGYVKGSK